MTVPELLHAIKHRWFIVLAALLSGAGLVALFAVNAGVYSTQTVVQFIHLEPSQGAISPNSDIENGNFIAFAGAVASEVNNGRPVRNYAWESAPLYGAGVRDGVRVAIPDSGGQWMQSFNRAEIVIQVVGPSEELVRSRQQELLQKVENSSRSLQGPAFNNRQSIRTNVVPLTTTIEHVVPSRAQQMAAVLSMLIASFMVGAWVAVCVDAAAARRREHRSSEQAQFSRDSLQMGAL